MLVPSKHRPAISSLRHKLDVILKQAGELLEEDRRFKNIKSVQSNMLNEVDMGSDSAFSTASTQIDSDTPFIADEIALFLLSQEHVKSLVIKASQKEGRSRILIEYFRPLVKRYGQELRKVAGDSLHITAAREIIKQSRYITDAILRISHGDSIEAYLTDAEARRSRIEALLKGHHGLTAESVSPETQSGLRPSTLAVVDIETFEDELAPNFTDPDDEASEPLGVNESALEEVRNFMLSNSHTLDILLSLLSRLVYADPLEAARDQLLRFNAHSVEPSHATFMLSWELPAYIEQEIKSFAVANADMRILKSLLVIAGRKGCFFTDTCEKYMKWKWPGSAEMLFEAMQTGGSVQDSARTIHLDFSNGPREALLSASGERSFLVDVAQQLLWLTASFRLPHYGQLSYSDALLTISKPGSYRIRTIPLQKADVGENACWSPLVIGIVIARDFPVPARRLERGLELPFHLMTALAGPLEPRLMDDGIYLQGYSRLLFPAEEHLDSGSLQWHLVATESRRELLSEDRVMDHTRVEIRDPEYLASRRTFLGHFRRALVDLGTRKTIEYHRNILYSSAEAERHPLRIQAPSSFNIGTSGMGIFGLQITIPIIPKSLAQTIEGQNDDYWDVLALRSNKSVIMYDNSGERAWMVPELIIALHMVHTWAAQAGTFKEQMPFAELTDDPGDAARKVLTDNWGFVLRDPPETNQSSRKTLKDLIMQFWHAMTSRQFKDLLARNSEVSNTALCGLEYLDIVLGECSERKQVSLHGKWRPFSDEVLVIFGQNFGDIIQPAPEIGVCGQWNPIPPNRSLLTATIRSLQHLSIKKGGRWDSQNCPKLTHKDYWDFSNEDLFADCKICLRPTSNEMARCPKKAQILVSTPSKRKGSHPVPPSEGAVVFDGCHAKLQKTKRLVRLALASR